MRRALFGTSLVSAAIAVMSAGCGAADGGALEKNPERVASTSAALAPVRADCNNGQFVTTTVIAQNMAGPWDQGPVYRRSVSDLLADLAACGTTACMDQYRYTSAIYSQVYGAAGYYYRVADMSTQGVVMDWIAIPVLDSTTTSPGYYLNYPGASAIHTPARAAPVFYGTTSTYAAPFWLRDNDHTNLWYVRDGSLNTANVMGRVKAEQCVAIVDPYGNFLDYSAELEEHDPNGCGGCRY